MACLGSACSEQTFSNDAEGNFDALWTILDEHYTFFEYKNVDWDAVGKQYRTKITKGINSGELFNLCSDMLKELKDGHTNLINASDVSRYWIWEKYPINYDERLIDEHYLNFEYKRTSGIKYQILSSNIGYMYYGDFSNGIGEGNLDAILAYLASSDGLIIDVRSNGGGFLTNVEKLVGRFINEKMTVGSISHKTGPATRLALPTMRFPNLITMNLAQQRAVSTTISLSWCSATVAVSAPPTISCLS